MDSAFTNKVAVVTGASSGIGRAIALRLTAEGATVCIVGRRMRALREVGKESGRGSLIHAFRVDLTNDHDIRTLVSSLQNDFAHIDILVHSAAIITFGSLAHASLNDLDLEFRTNLRAPYALTQALLPSLQRSCGQIVFINSTNGLKARATVGQYSAMKHGLKAMADSLRDEVNAEGIRVVSMFLGRTATPMQATIFHDEHRIYRSELLLNPNDVATMLVSVLSLPPTAEVMEIVMRPAIKSY